MFRQQRFLEGRDLTGSGVPDVWWFRPDGRRMTQRNWAQPGHTLGVFLNGEAIGTVTPEGEPVVDDSFVLCFNASHEDIAFTLPPIRFGRRWELELSTLDPDVREEMFPARGVVPVGSRSTVILRRL